MIKEAFGTGATVEEAVEAAKKALNAPEHADVSTEMIDLPQKKFLGLFGGSPAKARAYYEARIKDARKAEIESMKAAIREEDQENGVFYVVADCPEGQPTIVHPGEEYDGRNVLLPTGTEGR